MANTYTKISQLPLATALVGSEVFAAVQTGTTVQIELSQLDGRYVQPGTLAATTGASLIGFQQAGVGSVARTVQAKLREPISVLDFGADPTGVTPAGAAFTSTSTAGDFIVPPGNYLINASISINSKVTFMQGAVLHIATGVTVTFNAPITGPLLQIFNLAGTGAVAFADATGQIGHPEWWGALPNNNALDCSVGINASIVACPVTELQPALYYTTNTVILNTSAHTLRGIQIYPYNSTPHVPTIAVNSATITGLQIGAAASPIVTYGMTAANFNVTRVVAPTATYQSGPIGVQVSFTEIVKLDNVVCWDSCIGFYIDGTVYNRMTDCYAFRQTAATNLSSDFFDAYFFNGASGISAAGGNASTYLTRCGAECGVSALSSATGNNGSTGFVFSGSPADTYLHECEADGFTTGLLLVGSTGGAKNQSGDADVLISKCIFDAFYHYGIQILNVANYGAIKISDGYMAPASGAAATAALSINNCGTATGGNITITGCQGIGWPVACAPYVISSSYGVRLEANMWNDFAVTAQVTSLSEFTLRDSHSNPAATSPAAITLTTCSRGYVAPAIYGAASVFGAGVVFASTGNSYIEVNGTGIDPTSTTSQKVTNNAVTITAAGTFNTNCLASGIMN